MSNIYIFITNQVHLLDLSGVSQVFQEAQQLGFDYNLKFISNKSTVNSSSGLEFSSLIHFSKTNPKKNDIIFIPGFSTQQLSDYSSHDLFFEWLKNANANQTTICSICTGAFLLAKSGILDNQECTTHWRFIEKLKTNFPLLKPLDDRLFVKSKNIYSSAGVSTGIDLALFLIEERHGELNALKIARELAVYIRRNENDKQESVFLQFRNHQDQRIHTVQDWIIHNLDKPSTLESLANLIHISPRNLTRIFKRQTGITISEYRTKLKIERAKKLLQNSGHKVEHIAHLCGFKSSKQLRVILEKTT
ncbi:GlxA family transcriptional regulator [Aquimarina sediminis]|uniref:GlxA family transcriptional regulator n=1 Tax=Aquimarina sediminis TaxID=2070536 RepID=UPI000CA024A8|nr:DJ-1/PfpI family protein [Aquimarina sediminis]